MTGMQLLELERILVSMRAFADAYEKDSLHPVARDLCDFAEEIEEALAL